MKDVTMNDCRFVFDRENRTVVCYIEGTENMFTDYIDTNYKNCGILELYDKRFKMNNRFVGRAYCAAQDEWDENIGAHIAFYRMKRKLMDSFYNHIRMYFDMKEKELDELELNAIQYKAKVEKNLEKHLRVLMDVVQEN